MNTATSDTVIDTIVKPILKLFSFPVVPRGLARIRVQMSAGLEPHHIDKAVEAFIKVGRELGVIG